MDCRSLDVAQATRQDRTHLVHWLTSDQMAIGREAKLLSMTLTQYSRMHVLLICNA